MKWVFLSLGSLSFAGGVIVFPLPLPLGIPLMALGLALLYPYSRGVRVRLRYFARRSALASKVLARIDQTAVPSRVRKRSED